MLLAKRKPSAHVGNSNKEMILQCQYLLLVRLFMNGALVYIATYLYHCHQPVLHLMCEQPEKKKMPFLRKLE